MTRRKASFLQGTDAARYQLPAEDHRLNHAGLWAPSSVPGASALAVASGVVWGPGNPGGVVIVAGGVQVNPFHAAVQGSRSGVQGVFEVTSDAGEFRAIVAASSTQFRRGRLGVRIYDQLNGAAKDDWDIEVLYGPAAASAGAAQLPPVPVDSTWFELRQFAVDNTGAITLSGITPRTMPRGAILPVDAVDVTPGAYVGQYRDHPVNGLERWNGSDWKPYPAPGPWITPVLNGRTNLGGGYPVLRYRHLPVLDSVQIYGVLATGPQVNGVFILPVGSRPAGNQVRGAQHGDNAAAAVFVTSAGSVNVPATASWLSMDLVLPLS